MPKDFHRQRGGKAHLQSQCERVSFHPNYIKIPTFFKFQIDVHEYVPETYYTSANFHFNPFSGASPRIGGILSFVTFFLVSYFVVLYFFLGTRTDRTRG